MNPTIYQAPKPMPPTTKSDRLPITRRAKAPPSFTLTKRDVLILQALADYGQLTSEHIQRLYFPTVSSSSASCRLRLRLLYHHGYVQRKEQPQVLTDGRKPLVYFLDTLGARTLEEFTSKTFKRADPHINPHLLLINDLRVAVATSAQKNGWTVEQWVDERTIRRHNLVVSPDGYFRLVVPLERERVYHCVVECDRGTETLQTFAGKVSAYDTLYNSGKYREVFGATSMRVLVVALSVERMMNLKSAVEQAGGKSRYFFTTYEDLKGDIFTEDIWYLGGKLGKDRFFTP